MKIKSDNHNRKQMGQRTFDYSRQSSGRTRHGQKWMWQKLVKFDYNMRIFSSRLLLVRFLQPLTATPLRTYHTVTGGGQPTTTVTMMAYRNVFYRINTFAPLSSVIWRYSIGKNSICSYWLNGTYLTAGTSREVVVQPRSSCWQRKNAMFAFN